MTTRIPASDRTGFLIPRPGAVVPGEDRFTWPSTGTLSGSVSEAATFRKVLGPAGENWERADDALVRLLTSADLLSEGYRLTVAEDHVSVEYGEQPGLVWALQTLRQLLPVDAWLPGATGPWHLPTLQVDDAPRYGWRGALLDVARHFVPFPDLMRHVEMLSAHKFNVFHLHLTDDEGWRMESVRYPLLTQLGAHREESANPHNGGDGTPNGGFYTQAQLRALVAHASSLGITVVPEIDFPAHAASALRAYPEFGVTDAPPTETVEGQSAGVINLAPASMQFVFDVWEEALEIFPSQVVHIGGDEVHPGPWEASPGVRALATRLGLGSTSDLQAWFSEQLVDWLAERGRTAMAWDETIQGDDPPRVLAHYWREPADPSAAVRAGLDYVLAPTHHSYLDYYPSDSDDEPYCIGSEVTLETVLGFDPEADLSPEALGSLRGISCQLWTEFLPTYSAMEYLFWPRACAFAEVAWAGAADPDQTGFMERLGVHLERLDALGVGYRPLDGPHPWQRGGSGHRRRRKDAQAW